MTSPSRPAALAAIVLLASSGGTVARTGLGGGAMAAYGGLLAGGSIW